MVKLTIANPTIKMRALAENHPYACQNLLGLAICVNLLTHTIPTGPAGTENHNVADIDGSNPMMLKAIANT